MIFVRVTKGGDKEEEKERKERNGMGVKESEKMHSK